MKPTEFCNCIRCTDCQYYADCMESYIESERAKGKCSFGKLKVGRFPSIYDKEMKD